MKNTKTLTFILLPLLMLACTLTAQSPLPQQAKRGAIRPIMPAEQPPTQAPKTCTVTTGIDAGNLNLRTCAGIGCPVATVLHEGETLTQTQTVKGWLAVETASGLRGWVNSKYCKGK
jgi:uncharacterized protein YgiM (DUF1202 family)